MPSVEKEVKATLILISDFCWGFLMWMKIGHIDFSFFLCDNNIKSNQATDYWWFLEKVIKLFLRVLCLTSNRLMISNNLRLNDQILPLSSYHLNTNCTFHKRNSIGAFCAHRVHRKWLDVSSATAMLVLVRRISMQIDAAVIVLSIYNVVFAYIYI